MYRKCVDANELRKRERRRRKNNALIFYVIELYLLILHQERKFFCLKFIWTWPWLMSVGRKNTNLLHSTEMYDSMNFSLPPIYLFFIFMRSALLKRWKQFTYFSLQSLARIILMRHFFLPIRTPHSVWLLIQNSRAKNVDFCAFAFKQFQLETKYSCKASEQDESMGGEEE